MNKLIISSIVISILKQSRIVGGGVFFQSEIDNTKIIGEKTLY